MNIGFDKDSTRRNVSKFRYGKMSERLINFFQATMERVLYTISDKVFG